MERDREAAKVEGIGMLYGERFTEAFLRPWLAAGLIERANTDKRHGRRRRYRLTASGEALLQTKRVDRP